MVVGIRIDEPAVVVLGVGSPGGAKLLEVGEAGCPHSGFARLVQCGQENGDQQGDDPDDDQQLNQRKRSATHAFSRYGQADVATDRSSLPGVKVRVHEYPGCDGAYGAA